MKPVRKVDKSQTALCGFISSSKTNRQINVESSLERDFSYLLEYDIQVDNYIEQPVTISYELDGSSRKYTPDFLIKYIDSKQKPVLAEVKYRKDIRDNWTILKPKFKAAKIYASQNNWVFKVFTEDEIRSNYLNNIKFLLQYRNRPNLPNHDFRKIILQILFSVKASTPEEVLLMSFRDKNRQAELLPTLWYMVSTGLIGCNLFHNLTMKSCIWCVTD